MKKIFLILSLSLYLFANQSDINKVKEKYERYNDKQLVNFIVNTTNTTSGTKIDKFTIINGAFSEYKNNKYIIGLNYEINKKKLISLIKTYKKDFKLTDNFKKRMSLQLKKDLITSVCNTAENRAVLDRGINIKFIYILDKKEPLTEFILKERDCLKNLN